MNTGPIRLLLVEDSPADVFLVKEALSMHFPEAEITVAADGDVAVRGMEEPSSGKFVCPDLLLLDLNLPKRTGGEVLARFRQRCSRAPVIIITSSDSATDRAKVAKLGADYYFRKPSSYDEFMKLGAVARKLWESSHGVLGAEVSPAI